MKSSGVMLTSISSLGIFKDMFERESDCNFDIASLPSGVLQIFAKSSEEMSSVMIWSFMTAEQELVFNSLLLSNVLVEHEPVRVIGSLHLRSIIEVEVERKFSKGEPLLKYSPCAHHTGTRGLFVDVQVNFSNIKGEAIGFTSGC